MKKYFYGAIVKRVIDGDTLILDIDLGFNIQLNNQRCRLARINAPEKKTEAGIKTLEFLKQIENQEVLIESYKLDKYGRRLIEVYWQDLNINSTLLENNFAVLFKL